MSKITIPDVLPVIYDYYAQEGNGVGGSLHIVLEDGNIEDNHIEWCKKYALEKGDYQGSALADILLHMTKTQRHKLYSKHSFYKKVT